MTDSAPPAGGRWGIGIASLFSIVIGASVLLSVGTLLAVSTISARLDLVRGLADEFDLLVGTIEERVDGHLSVVEDQLGYLEDWLGRDPTLGADEDRLADALRAALAATPQVTSIALVRPDGGSVRVERSDDRVHRDDLSHLPEIGPALAEAAARGPDGQPMGWSEPLYSDKLGRSIVVRRQALWRDGRFAGLLLAGADLLALSRYTRDASSSIGRTVFILHGADAVIAHPALTEGAWPLSTERPLPTIGEIGDARLAAIWRDDRRPVISQAQMTRSQGHYFRADGRWQVFGYAETRRYGPTPWLIGFHFDSTQASAVQQFWKVLAIGVGLLVLFTGFGAWLGRRLSRPFRVLTENAAAIRRLDLDHLARLAGSRIRELDRAADAFEAMVGGLRVFERYVPKRLVERILRDGRQDMQADNRRITLLFVDIVGFSPIAENLTPAETAAFLNDYFSMVGACIEATDGTIDKYLGDGLLAFWGAPEAQEDHALRACRAALAVGAAVAAENRRRAKAGRVPIRVRIGLHSGDALVGDIGAASRINYTAIGDTVNVARRVEDAGRDFATGDVTVLATEATVEAVRTAFATERIGPTALRGLSRPIVLFRLLGRS